MAVKTRVDPIDRDIQLMLAETLSPKAKSQAFAEFAETEIDRSRSNNRQILGRNPRVTITVDGREGAPLASVRADGGIIIAEFELFNDVLVWIASQLELHSPVKSGRYQSSHTLFADGVEIDPTATVPQASEFVFINVVPYARKIERGSSSQAPDGVYQAVAVLAQRRFGNVARITFSYRTAMAGMIVGGRQGDRSSERNPAIVVRVRG